MLKSIKADVPDKAVEDFEIQSRLRGTELTRKMIKAYLKQSDRCPRCLSDSYEGGSIEIDKGMARQDLYCCVCGLTWTDNYKLKSVTWQDDTEGP